MSAIDEKVQSRPSNAPANKRMSNRENFLRALRRDNPERVPFEFVLCPSYIDEIEKKTGTRDYLEYFGFPIRYVELNPTRKKTDFTRYYENLSPAAEPLSWNPEWGILGLQGSIAHFQEMLHPMKNFSSVEQIKEYPFPDFNEAYRWEGVAENVSSLIKKDLIAVAFMQMTIFEMAWYLRGMDNLMIDMMMDPEFAAALFDAIAEIRTGVAEKFARAGVDILMLGDDVSTQLDMMISPEQWRELFKPRMAKIIQAAKKIKPDLLVFYHGDGNLQKIIPDLIEIGIDILNPVQPECMDPIEIKRLYGDRLTLWGTLGTQSTMPFGTPAKIKEKCRELIEKVGKGGGLILAPTHMIEPDVPWQNVEAFIEAVKS